MTTSSKKRWLNGIMITSVLFLLVVATFALKRVQDQRAYEMLSAQRELQLNEKIADAQLNPDSSSADRASDASAAVSDRFQKGAQKSPIDPEPVSASFVYKENANKEWLDINADFMGWLQIPGSKIDYPFVRSRDNADYLKRDFYGNYSESGSLFMDYRNIGNFNDRHTLIYGHNMKNKSMFHGLTYYQDAKYFSENRLVTLSGLYETKIYKVFSVYEISADDYTFKIAFDDDSRYLEYLQELEELSLHSGDMELSAEQRLLTLVTCSYGVNNGRTIVHALEMP